MTEVLDMHGNTIRVGARVLDENGQPDGTVIEIGEPDGDVNEYGRAVGINPVVSVRADDTGGIYLYDTRWNATGPWDDHRDDYTCDDLEIAVDGREPDGLRMEGGRIVPTDR